MNNLKYPPNLKYLFNELDNYFEPTCINYHLIYKAPDYYFIITTPGTGLTCVLTCNEHISCYERGLYSFIIIKQDYIKNFNKDEIKQKINKTLLLL
jgi:hypothetical protein